MISYKIIKDPPWHDLMDHTQPKKTIQTVAQAYRIKQDNTVIQQYNP